MKFLHIIKQGKQSVQQFSTVNRLLEITCLLSAESCSTRDSPCQIPFLYKGNLQFECSAQAPGAGDIAARCPTKLNNNNTRTPSLKVSETK